MQYRATDSVRGDDRATGWRSLLPADGSRLLIGGKLVSGGDGVFTTVNPATEAVIGHAAKRWSACSGALAAQGTMDTAGIQIGAAPRNEEPTEAQLHEIALFRCYYIGWPTGTKLDLLVETIVAQPKKAARKQSAQVGESESSVPSEAAST